MSTFSRWVLVAAVAVAVLGSLAQGFGSPPLATADETAHLDYAVQVWHGHLPVFENGLTIHPAFGAAPPVQWVAQHPPLFYLLLAPVVGPLVDAGHMDAAVLAGRVENAFLAGVVVLATAWSARRILPGRPAVAAVAAIVTALCGLVLLVGGTVYNDLLTAAFSALAIGVAATALRSGLSTRLVVLGALVTAFGMLSRLSFAVSLVAVVAAFALAPVVRSSVWRAVRVRLAAVVAVVVAPAIASGWFYWRNRELTGSITGGHPEWSQANLGRVTRPVTAVALDPAFWHQLFAVYRFGLSASSIVPWLLLLVPLLLAGAGALAWCVRNRSWRGSRADRLVSAMLVCVVLATIVVELRYVAGGGAANTRYALPLLPVLAVPMAMGLTGISRLRVVLVPLWTVGAAIVFAVSIDLVTVNGAPMVLVLARVAYALALAAIAALTALVVPLLATLSGCRSAN